MKRLHGALIVLLAILLLLPSAPVAHAAPPQQDALTSTFLILFPELRALPAPEWVQPGVRVTYSDMSASIAQVAGEEGTGGAGLLQYDLVARERRVVPLYARLFLDLGDGRYQSNLTYGVASPAGAGEFWVNPIALRRADSLNLPDLDVNRVQYEVAGERFDAVRFDYSGRGFVSAWVIDSESGLLLFSRTASEGTTHTQQSSRTFVGLRTLEIPWEAGNAPRGLQAGDVLRYEGVNSTWIAGSPEPTNLALAATLEVDESHTRWNLWTTSLLLNGNATGASPQITGGLQLFGGYWLPPSAFDVTVRRPIIDRDPITGATVSYQRRSGKVTLTETGSGYESVLLYGRDGLLAASRLTTEVLPAVVVYDLQRVE